MDKYLAIDIGGSSVKYALLTNEGEFLEKGSYRSERYNFEIFKEAMSELIIKFRDNYDVKGVAVSAPGGVDSESGVIKGLSALPCIHGPNFKEIFGKGLGLKLEIENDANCAALGEVWKGSAKENEDVLFIVCGTGIGGAVIKNKKVHKGFNLHGGEFGLCILDWKRDEEGFKGLTWSQLGSTEALVKRAADSMEEDYEALDGREIFYRAEEGNLHCIKAIDEFYFYNALGIYNLQYTYDPEKIVLGGAISSRDDFIYRIKESLKVIMDSLPFAKVTPIVESCFFQNDSNLLGALYNYLQRNSLDENYR